MRHIVHSAASVLVLVTTLGSVAFAQTASTIGGDENSGRAKVFDILTTAVSPRAAALGNTFVAMKDDPTTLFTNPAALSTQTKRDSSAPGSLISVGYTTLPVGADQGMSKGYLVYSQPAPEFLGSDAWIGFGAVYMDYGTFQGADALGQATSTFSASDVVLSAAYSSIIPEQPVRYGVTVKYISSTLVSGSYSASGLAADLGVFYESKPLLLTIGASALNIGKQLSSYNGVMENLPFNLEVGVSKKLERLPLTVHLAFRNLTRDREGRNFWYALNDFSIGGEFTVSKVVRLRFGYENQKRRDLETPSGLGMGGFSFGFGMVFQKLHIDYSLSAMGPAISDVHRFGAAYLF
ncbi:MAG: PorV/PorQ family protein [Bacteroidetes bacterium]|nr:PorV/PorQ family protein [Bacteroidota bacterium]